MWWQQWGKSTPALQFVAMRALAQTVSASCSEQACNWSECDFVHSRRRNRLGKEYASLLVRGHNHARLAKSALNKCLLLGQTVTTTLKKLSSSNKYILLNHYATFDIYKCTFDIWYLWIVIWHWSYVWEIISYPRTKGAIRLSCEVIWFPRRILNLLN